VHAPWITLSDTSITATNTTRMTAGMHRILGFMVSGALTLGSKGAEQITTPGRPVTQGAGS
jgi:hypothetical protein